MTETALLIGIGLGGGFLAGVSGLGGALVLAPLLLALPPLLGFRSFGMHEIAAITLAYLAFATGAAILRARGRLEPAAFGGPGLVGVLAAVLGGLLSAQLAARTLLVLFTLFASLASLSLLLPRRLQIALPPGRWGLWLSGLTAAGAGLITGLVGAAGGFLIAPGLRRLVRTERAAAQAALQIVLASALGGLLGKGLTGQLHLTTAAALVGGALPTAWWGGEISARVSPLRLRWVSLTVALASATALWVTLMPELVRRLRPGHLYLAALAAGLLVPSWLLARVQLGRVVKAPMLRPVLAAQGRTVDRLEPVQPEELRRAVLEGPVPQVIDLREPEEVAEGWIPGAVNIPAGQFSQWLEVVGPRDGAVIVCTNGEVSAEASTEAAALGYRVRHLEGGMNAWDGPLERPGEAWE